ncbi:MAG: DUF1517 domain-containing protein [Deltaproteobacteria bacterium]|nr:DUF1517 domain-containing protein [Deltaproteobacteria bacterium]
MRSPIRIPNRKAVAVAVVALLLVGAVSVAWARSGGSFGGGFKSSSRSSSSSFRSSSSSSSSRSFGSSSSRSWGSSSSSAPSYGGTRYVPVPVPTPGSTYYFGAPRPYRSYTSWHHHSSGGSVVGAIVSLIVVGIIFFVIVAIIVAVVRARRRSTEAGGDGGGYVPQPTHEKCDVWLLQFGVQMQARDVQDALEALAARTDADSEDSLSYALRELAHNLQGKLEHVEYAAVRGTEKMPMAKAEDQFQLWSSNERAKFNREVIRGDSSGVRRQQKEWKTDGIRDEDGQLAVAEFFVVSVVLAVRGKQFARQIHGTAELTALLEELATVTGQQLVALEVVWSPAARSDAMSREDMEGRYPELAPV